MIKITKYTINLKSTFEDLESVLTMTPNEFAEKYSQPKQKEQSIYILIQKSIDENKFQNHQVRLHLDKSDKDESSKISIEQINEINEPIQQNDMKLEMKMTYKIKSEKKLKPVKMIKINNNHYLKMKNNSNQNQISNVLD
ncbi:unnamed protein product [Paramecium sonneborni]|uniref:Uncharacterized protein n=1 Tax=Paramecium sonneborni TaxID=65129 RepID=A0A8S1LL67_9CILI|nr:unnamed protein product [Paramecium sonneborni]